MSKQEFQDLIAQVTGRIAGRSLDEDLARALNQDFPGDGPAFKKIEALCHDAIAAGWMCENEHGGIKYGRVVEAGPDTGGFSVDVVHMTDVKGPHHRHPNGEIDMIMPIDGAAAFDGHGRGWCVYGPDSAHHPTVSGGAALVLYLLPGGAIEFTGR